jgi:photosystem II stability/assembly factor-like uncharacterized protein
MGEDRASIGLGMAADRRPASLPSSACELASPRTRAAMDGWHLRAHNRLSTTNEREAGRILRSRCSEPGRLVIAVVALSAMASMIAASSAHVAAAGTNSHGPGTRGYSAFAINPESPRIIYVGTGFGILKSGDAGRTWRQANDGLADRYVMDLVISRSAPEIVYAATRAGVFKSTTSGARWRDLGLTSVTALAVDPREANTIYAARDDGVYKRAHGARSWQRVMRGRRVFAVAIDPTRPETIYAGAGNGVFKSTNGGRRWQAMNRGLFPRETQQQRGHRLAEGFVLAFAINPRRPQVIYLGSNYGVFKSTNAARSWRSANAGIRGHGKFRSVGSLVVDPLNPTTLYAGHSVQGGVSKTSNGGRTWSAAAKLPRSGYPLALAIDPRNPRTVYAGTTRSGGGEAYKSTDGGRTWRQLPLDTAPR